MSTEQPNPAPRPENPQPEPEAGTQTWGEAQPPKPAARWSGRKTLAAVAIAAGIAAAGGTAVYAGTSADGGDQRGGMGPGMADGRFPGMRGGVDGTAITGALHGDFVVPDGDGGYQTQRMQIGEVTESDDSSITVASEDGYTRSYVVGPSTQRQGDVAIGDTVRVTATVSGDTATATSIVPADQAGPGVMPGGMRTPVGGSN